MSSSEEVVELEIAISVSCLTCGAAPGAPCVGVERPALVHQARAAMLHMLLAPIW